MIGVVVVRHLRLRVVRRLLAAVVGVVLAAGPTLAMCTGAPAGDGCHDCCAAGAPDQPRTVGQVMAVHAPAAPAVELPLPWSLPRPTMTSAPPAADGTPPIPVLLQTTVLLV